ncbi:hypothetical protein [Priestia megaterium]|uniref:hypothetical protein n=1 Tax=Priestia megaterium TaxID=1404 RepID=UPI0015E287D3|nr:hypothetical protein [Priestia megaterium]
MEKGTKLIALWNEKFIDMTTKGKEYIVEEVNNFGFWIINDEGEKIFPVSTKFKKINQ